MAVRETLNFDSGVVGSAITAVGDLTVSGALYTADAVHGALAATFPNNTSWLRVDNTGTATHSGSMYVKVTANPGSSAARVVTFTTGSNTILLAVRMHSNGKFDIAGSAGSPLTVSTISWVVGKTYRLDWQWNQVSTAAPVLTVRIFATAEGTTPDDTLTWTASALGSATTRWQFGTLSSTAAFTGVIDTIRISDGLEWIGPFSTIRETFLFDTGTDGAAVGTTGNLTSSGTTYIAAGSIHGGMSAKFNDNTQYMRVENTGTATHSGQIYYKPLNNPGSSAARVVVWTNSANNILLTLRCHSDGKFDIAASAGTRLASSTISWTAGTTYRISWQWDGTSSAAPVLTIRIYGTAESPTPDDTITYTASGVATATSRWQFGALSSSAAFSAIIDTIRLTDGAIWMGAYGTYTPPPPPAAGGFVHAWVGGPTPDGFFVTSKTTSASSLRLVVGTDSGVTTDLQYSLPVVPDADGYTQLQISGLQANTRYWYQLEDTPTGGSPTRIGEIGKARTLIAAGVAKDFTFAFGGCTTTNATQSAALTDILAWDPLFFIHMGDFHYKNPTSTTQSVHAQDWADQIAGATGMHNFVRDMPMFYIRSDHDAGPGDNLDSNVASNQASINAFKQVVPRMPLADTRTPTVGLYFSWVVGRVRFIAVDIRNMDRSPGLDAQSPAKTMLGATQKAWLKNRLLDPEPVKVIVSDVPWNGPAAINNGQDKWWSYDDERTEIGNFVVANNVTCLLIHSDAHALIADKTHNGAAGGFPIYGAAPLANVGGGRNLTYNDQVYSTGSSTQSSQYGRVTVTDDGELISFSFVGWDALTATPKIAQIDVFAAPSPVLVPPGYVLVEAAHFVTIDGVSHKPGDLFALTVATAARYKQAGYVFLVQGNQSAPPQVPRSSLVQWTEGVGSPEGVVVGGPGSVYSRTDGSVGTSFYVKESGLGAYGWSAVLGQVFAGRYLADAGHIHTPDEVGLPDISDGTTPPSDMAEHDVFLYTGP